MLLGARGVIVIRANATLNNSGGNAWVSPTWFGMYWGAWHGHCGNMSQNRTESIHTSRVSTLQAHMETV